jgi:pimeloyl-ACP methyl ester carboxylesterase
MQMVEGAGVQLAYEEHGSGMPLLMVHGMGEDHRAWSVLAGELDARTIAYDRRGYGDSGAPDPYVATTVAEQAEDALALLRALDAVPAVALGADLGALVALDLLLRHPGTLRAAVLVDPAAFALVAAATEPLAGERSALEVTLRARGPAAAVAQWRSARGRDGAPPATPHAFFADFGGQASMVFSRRQLRTLDVPLAILESPGAPAHVRAAADALAALLPHATRGRGDDVAGTVRALL